MAASPIKKTLELGFPWQTLDPFLFCVHHLDQYPKGGPEMALPQRSLLGRNLGNDFTVKDGWRMYHGRRVPGFPVHPHRGFETVTVVLQGTVDHADSTGAAGRYGDGDVQWMTAGAGIQHAEMFPLIHEDRENPLELFQIWLNLPARSKFVPPHYAMLWREEVPIVAWNDESGKRIQIRVVAGALDKAEPPSPPPDSWATDPSNEVLIWVVDMDAGARWNLPLGSSESNRVLYSFEGEDVQINGEALAPYHGALLHCDVPTTVVANTPSRFLLLQGRPIGEPVAQYGPFVMNTSEEIKKAYEDYGQTQFGGWPWPVDDPVHPKEQDRFERHSDQSNQAPPMPNKSK